MIDDDFPAVVCVFEDEREEAFRIAAVFFASFQAIFSGDDGEVFVERMHLKIGKTEGTHGGSGGVIALVLLEQAGKTTEDLVGDEEGVGRVFESVDVAGEVAFIPGVLLGKEHFDDVELLARGGVERVRLLCGEEGWCDESEAESCETEGEAKRHKGSREESCF